jgi:RNA polymerase sigma-70 factor (ECF subfamily)
MDARALVEGLRGERARFVRFARLRVATEADADDVVQRALLRASEHAQSVEDRSRALAWFYRILRRTLVDHHRARTRDRAKSDASVDPDDLADCHEEGGSHPKPCACALRLLDDLRPAYAEVVRRVDWGDEEPRDVAKALGVTDGNLYVRLHRARRILRDRVKDHCGVTTRGPCLDCTCDSRSRCGDAISA